MEPMLSCIETIIVGRIGTVMLAALGPGTQLFAIIGEVAAVFSVCTVTTVSRCAAAGDRTQVRTLLETGGGRKLHGHLPSGSWLSGGAPHLQREVATTGAPHPLSVSPPVSLLRR